MSTGTLCKREAQHEVMMAANRVVVHEDQDWAAGGLPERSEVVHIVHVRRSGMSETFWIICILAAVTVIALLLMRF